MSSTISPKTFLFSKTSILTLIIMILFTLFISYFTYQKSLENQKIIFSNNSNKTVLLIEERMKAYQQVLLSGVAKFYTTEKITRQNWKKFVEELKLDKNYPGIQGIGFSLMIKPEDIENHILEVKKEGFPDYHIQPIGKREIYSSIIYLEPFNNRNKRAFGYDMYSEKTRNKAMSKAIETGEFTVSGKVKLMQENGVDIQSGFLAYIPVYKPNMQMTTFEERLLATYGFVYAPFRFKDFIESIGFDENNFLDIEIFDESDILPDSLLYDSIPDYRGISKNLNNQNRLLDGRRPTANSEKYLPDIYYEHKLSIGGHNWLIKIYPSEKFLEDTSSYAYIFVFLISFLIELFVFSMINIYRYYERKKQIYYDDLSDISIKKELALKTATIGIWEWEYEKNTIIWDSIMYKIYGVKETTNKNLFDIWKDSIDSSYKNHVLTSLFKSKKNNLEHNIKFWITTPSGEKKFIHSLGKIEFNKQQKAIAMLGVNIDITEYENNKLELITQKEIAESKKAKFESIFNHSKDGIFVMDLSTKFLFLNNSFSKIIQYSNDEILEKSILELVDSEDFTKINSALIHTLKNEFLENIEIHFITKNRKKIPTIISIVLLPDKKRFLITVKDFTETKRKEGLIRNYIELIDKNVITSSTDLEGKINYVSEAFCNISGYSKEELIGKTHDIVRSPDISTKVYEDMWKLLLNDKTWEGELKNIRKDGKEYWVKVTISPNYNEDKIKIGYTAIREDITDKKIIEQISITDGLTNIFNRRHFNNVFPKYIQGAKRRDELVCFALMDVDHFKQYNDTYGHQMGDEALKRVAEVLKNSLQRAEDYCFRLGGEEFGILFKTENIEKALEFTNIIRQNIENSKIIHEKNSASPYVTISIGLFCKNAKEITNDDDVYKFADEALYSAKESGRNRVILN